MDSFKIFKNTFDKMVNNNFLFDFKHKLKYFKCHTIIRRIIIFMLVIPNVFGIKWKDGWN